MMDVEMRDGAEEHVELSTLQAGECFCVGSDATTFVDPVVFLALRAVADAPLVEGYRRVVLVERGELCIMMLTTLVQPVHGRLVVTLRDPEDGA